MAKIIYLPVIKISRNMRRAMDAAYEWEDKGFSHEVAVAAGSICAYIDKLERRIRILENKENRQKYLSRMHVKKSPTCKSTGKRRLK